MGKKERFLIAKYARNKLENGITCACSCGGVMRYTKILDGDYMFPHNPLGILPVDEGNQVFIIGLQMRCTKCHKQVRIQTFQKQ